MATRHAVIAESALRASRALMAPPEPESDAKLRLGRCTGMRQEGTDNYNEDGKQCFGCWLACHRERGCWCDPGEKEHTPHSESRRLLQPGARVGTHKGLYSVSVSRLQARWYG